MKSQEVLVGNVRQSRAGDVCVEYFEFVLQDQYVQKKINMPRFPISGISQRVCRFSFR